MKRLLMNYIFEVFVCLDKYHSLLFSGGLWLEFLFRGFISSLEDHWRRFLLKWATIWFETKLHIHEQHCPIEGVASGVLDLLRSSLFWEAFFVGVCLQPPKRYSIHILYHICNFIQFYSVSFTLCAVSAQYCVILWEGFLISVCYQFGGRSLGVRLAFPWWSMDWVVDPCLYRSNLFQQ